MANHKAQVNLRIAALGGYLEGLSFLSKDSRSNFATAFEIEASNVADFVSEVVSKFEHLPDLSFDIDKSYQGDIYQLEQVIMPYLLVDPHINDGKSAEDMRKYLSFKILDRISLEIENLRSFEPPKRIVGRSSMLPDLMVFYLLTSPKINFALQFSECKD